MKLFIKDIERYFYLRRLSVGRPSKFLYLLTSPFNPRHFAVFIYRLSSSLFRIGVPIFPNLLSMINKLIFNIDIPPRVEIGAGLYLPHPQNIVIGASIIGRNAVIYQNVTIGAKFLDFEFSSSSRPIIGNDVIIGTGAVIVGGIVIGDDVRVGPNQIVSTNISPGVRVTGTRGG